MTREFVGRALLLLVPFVYLVVYPAQFAADAVIERWLRWRERGRS